VCVCLKRKKMLSASPSFVNLHDLTIGAAQRGRTFYNSLRAGDFVSKSGVL
jgi:hypothetical protein